MLFGSSNSKPSFPSTDVRDSHAKFSRSAGCHSSRYEAAFGKVDAPGTGLVDIYELADALRVMGKSERDIQQLPKELAPPLPQPYLHNAGFHDVPDVKSTGLVDKQELADAWREMGITERENQQLVNELNVEQRKKDDLTFPSTIFSQRRLGCGRFERYCAENANGTISRIEVTSVLARRTVPLAPQRSLPLQTL